MASKVKITANAVYSNRPNYSLSGNFFGSSESVGLCTEKKHTKQTLNPISEIASKNNNILFCCFTYKSLHTQMEPEDRKVVTSLDCRADGSALETCRSPGVDSSLRSIAVVKCAVL